MHASILKTKPQPSPKIPQTSQRPKKKPFWPEFSSSSSLDAYTLTKLTGIFLHAHALTGHSTLDARANFRNDLNEMT
jgi:hypothetical protein